MRKVIAEFEAVYAKVNHRVSRYGEAGFSITELGLIATADKVKPVLLKRPLGKSDPAAAHKGVREAYIGGRWHKANLYEMDLLQPGHEVIGPGHRRASGHHARRPSAATVSSSMSGPCCTTRHA